MKNSLVFLVLAALLLVSSPIQAQAPVVSQAAPLVRDVKAIAVFGQAVNAYKALKAFSAEIFEFKEAADEPMVYTLEWAPPGRALLLIKGLGVRADTKSVADGKNVFRLFPRDSLFGTSKFDRVPMRNATDADAIFTASPLLFFGIGPLLSGENLAQNEKIARGVTMGVIPLASNADQEDKSTQASMTASMDVVQIQTVFPGESPDKLTDLIYGFDKKTHRLGAFWLRRTVSGRRATAQTLVVENLKYQPKAEDFVWKAPKGVKEVPFRGLFFTTPTKTIRPTLEPAAMALLDKAAATYGGLKTLQMRVAGTGWSFDTRTKVSCSLFYERPDKIRIEDRTDGSLSLHVSDGKTMFYQDEKGSFSNPLDSIPGAMGSITFPVGKYLADWTQGRHAFQPALLSDTLRDALLLEVIHLPARSLNGQTVEGVRIRSKNKETGRLDLFREEILWLKPDGALARIQFQSRRGLRVGNGAIDVISQTFDAPIPAAEFTIPTTKAKR